MLSIKIHWNLFRRYVIAAVMTAIAVSAYGYYPSATYATGSATFALSPTSVTAIEQATFTVNIMVNSGAEAINAVEPVLAYPTTKLEYIGLDETDTAFSFAAPVQDSGGLLSIPRGSATPRTGSQLVVKVIFKMKTGSAAVNFDASSAIIRSSDASNIYGSGTGGVYAVPSGCNANCLPVYRLYNWRLGRHFYTTDANEKNYLSSLTDYYRYEGTSSYGQVTPVAGTKPIYRLYNFALGLHFYTTDANEKNYLSSLTDYYRYEGIMYYGFNTSTADTVPVHRFYNFITGLHMYTSNDAEYQYLNSLTNYYRYEGVSQYNIPSS